MSLKTQDVDVYLRSINIKLDADFPERIAHFEPTTKSIHFMQDVLEHQKNRAFFITAPYGSGKSLIGSYLLQLIENRSSAKPILTDVSRKIKKISTELADTCNKRRYAKKKGLVIVLHGYCDNFAVNLKAAIKESFERSELKLGRELRTIDGHSANNFKDALSLLTLIIEKAKNRKEIDRVLLVWDEFGQHIESLVAKGDLSSIQELQTLAEFSSRARKVPFSVALLTHQQLMFYANHLPQSVKKEWSKIEARFKHINYVEDSKELYQLISKIVFQSRGNNLKVTADIKNTANQLKKAGLYRDFSAKELQALLAQSAPIDPVLLYLLPRIASRVAQNERTLFDFLNNIQFSEETDASVLYNYFSSSMQSDTSYGGTYKLYMETESALNKVHGETNYEHCLKIACLLSFGVAGERASAKKDALLLALNKLDVAPESIVDELIDRKLLLYRKHSDEVSVWHGTDLDLRNKIEEQKSRIRDDFDILPFLAKELPPPVWKPVQYNDTYGIKRYFESEIISCTDIDETRINLIQKRTMSDGLMLYFLPASVEDIGATKKLLKTANIDDKVVSILPEVVFNLSEQALELFCIMQLKYDDELINSDPLVLVEIQHAEDDARAYLTEALDKLYFPGEIRILVSHQSEFHNISSAKQLRTMLSDITAKIYSKTPKINNELINRNKPTGTVINSRKKLEMAVLERNGQEMFGITGNFPDASMARTVLINTGIYVKIENGYEFKEPSNLKDNGLAEVWGQFKQFLTEPSKKLKSFEQLFQSLKAPPYGMREGVFPVLLVAALKAFPSARTLSKKGIYLSDILPSDIEEICRAPEDYEVTVFAIDEAKQRYLEMIIALFGHGKAIDIQLKTSDLVRECFETINRWLKTLPNCALKTQNLGKDGAHLQSCLKSIEEPAVFLLQTIPHQFGYELEEYQELFAHIKKGKCELETSQVQYYRDFKKIFKSTLNHIDSEESSVLNLGSKWVSHFDEDFSDTLDNIIAGRLIEELKTENDDEEYAINSISTLITSKYINQWDDFTKLLFERDFKQLVIQIEDAFIARANAQSSAQSNKQAVNIIISRLEQKYLQLVEFAGEDTAVTTLNNLKFNNGDVENGNNARSAARSKK